MSKKAKITIIVIITAVIILTSVALGIYLPRGAKTLGFDDLMHGDIVSVSVSAFHPDTHNIPLTSKAQLETLRAELDSFSYVRCLFPWLRGRLWGTNNTAVFKTEKGEYSLSTYNELVYINNKAYDIGKENYNRYADLVFQVVKEGLIENGLDEHVIR